MEILLEAKAVRNKIAALFSKKTRSRRRVILVAYVGQDAPMLIPDARGVEIYCWPQVGATHPGALATLRSPDFGATLYFVDRLHMKLYWVEGEGFIIGSANLSRNALGDHGLREAAIFIPDASLIEIDEIIKSLERRPVRTEELVELQGLHDLFWTRNSKPAAGRRRSAQSFKEWQREPKIRPWKLGPWDSEAEDAPSARALALENFGTDKIANFIDCREGVYKPGDWVLCFKVTKKQVRNIEWMFVEAVNQLADNEIDAGQEEYTHQALQIHARPAPLQEPFKLDAKFKRAFSLAAKSFGLNKLKSASSAHSPKALIRCLKREYGLT